MSSQNQKNQKKVQVQPERKAFQFSEYQEEDLPAPSTNVVVMPEVKKSTGPWSDDLIEDKDDPSWTTVKRKIRKTK
jgi:hypothetical protein